MTITSPADNETFAHADIVRIDLEFENAETAVLTLENTTIAGPDPVTFHVTVHDADGSGNATVYFNPLQAFDGPVADCGSGVPVEDCSGFVVPDDHRNHGFFTHPDDNGTVLRDPDRPAAVRDAPGETERAGGSAGEYVTPARVAYELSASAGSEVDIDHRRYPDDATTVRLAAIEDCSMELLTAPRTGPGALDPSDLQRFEDVEAAMEEGVITPPDSDRTVPIGEYVVFDIRAPGLGGIFHEAARQRGAEREAAFLDGESTLTDVFRDAVGRYDGGLDSVRLDVLSRGERRVEIDPESSIERVVAERDWRGNLARYVVVLRLEPGTAVTRGSARLQSGTVLNGTFSVSTTGRHRGGLSVVPRDSEQPLPLIAWRSDELGWTFYDSPDASISAGFTSPPSVQEVGENITFNGLRSDGIIGGYEWAFGDGTTATGRSVEHAYGDPGEYTVELFVTGPGGTDTASVTVTVEEAGGEATTDDGSGPGLGVLAALAALVGVAGRLRQRRR